MIRWLENRAHLQIAIAVCASLLAAAGSLPAQENRWMSTPYESTIWIALPDDGETRGLWQDRIQQATLARCRAYFGAAMRFEVSAPPQEIISALEAADSIKAPPDVMQRALEQQSKDKVFLVVVTRARSSWQIFAAEYDCRTRLWSHTHHIQDVPLSALDRKVAPAVFSVFRCIGKITRSDQGKTDVTIEMRSGLLASLSQAQAIPQKGSVLYPVIRRISRRDETAAEANQIPFTLLRVESTSRDVTAGESNESAKAEGAGESAATSRPPVPEGKVRCRIDSGLKAPLRSRTARQVEKLALLVTPMYGETVFKLRNASAPHDPLLGYEVHVRLPESKTLNFVGRTGWQGIVRVPRDEHPYKIYYIKHGKVLLARLPYAAGLEPTLELDLVDQRERLLAEAFVNGIRDDLLDIVVRRELAASKVRKHVDKELVTENDIRRATELLERVKQLNRADELVKLIDSREARFQSVEPSVQKRIDRMFAMLRNDIRKTVSSSYITSVKNTIESAKLRMAKPASAAE